MRDRTSTIVVGRKRSGKTTFVERMCQIYGAQKNRFVIVYNYGRPTDFKEFQEVTINLNTGFLYAEDKKAHLSKISSGLYKIKSFDTIQEHDKLYHILSKYASNCLFIVDDAASIIENNRMTPKLERICSKPDHLYIDTALVFHCLNYVPPKLFMYATHAIQFQTVNKPHKSKSERIPEFKQLEENYYILKEKPNYYYFIKDFISQTNQIFQPLKT